MDPKLKLISVILFIGVALLLFIYTDLSYYIISQYLHKNYKNDHTIATITTPTRNCVSNKLNQKVTN